MQKCGNKCSIASLQTWLRMLLLQWVRRLSRLKEEWSYSWRVWMFRSSGVLNITILSISLLEYLLPAWPHLLNWRWISKPVCLFTTWLGNSKELSSAKITLPDFSFKLRIDQERKLKHIRQRKLTFAQKVCSLFFSLLSLSAVLTDCCFSD